MEPVEAQPKQASRSRLILERLYLTAFVPSLVIGMLLTVVAWAFKTHDVVVKRSAASCWRALEEKKLKADPYAKFHVPTGEPWQRPWVAELDEACGTNTYREANRVYVRGAWNSAWFDVLDHDVGKPTYYGWGDDGWVSVCALLPAGLLWALRRWLLWLTKPA